MLIIQDRIKFLAGNLFIKGTVLRVTYLTFNGKMAVVPEVTVCHPLGRYLRRNNSPADAPFIVLCGEVTFGARLFNGAFCVISQFDVLNPCRLKQLSLELLEFRSNFVLHCGVNQLQLWVEIDRRGNNGRLGGTSNFISLRRSILVVFQLLQQTVENHPLNNFGVSMRQLFSRREAQLVTLMTMLLIANWSKIGTVEFGLMAIGTIERGRLAFSNLELGIKVAMMTESNRRSVLRMIWFLIV